MTAEEQSAFDAVMQLLASYAKKDVQACMSAISTSRPILLMGTNKNEIFRSAQEVGATFKRDFEHMFSISWGEPRLVHVTADDVLATVILELPLYYRSDGKDVKTLFRYALTLTQESGQWKICCGMACMPFAAGSYEFSE